MNSTDADNWGQDNWGQLLSDFGIEDHVPEEPAVSAAIPSADTVSPFVNTVLPTDEAFGAGLTDSSAESVSVSDKIKERKSIFSRFPKVNFFGVPPQVSLDSVLEGTKSPVLGGKGFIENTLESVPLSQERNNRPTAEKDSSNSWALVASQIESLASSEEPQSQAEPRRTKRHIVSMFDEPIPESEESRALKNLMGEPAPNNRQRKDVFLEEEPDDRPKKRGKRNNAEKNKECRQFSAAEDDGESREHPARFEDPQDSPRYISSKHGNTKQNTRYNDVSRPNASRYKVSADENDIVEADFEPIEDDIPPVRSRGGRGSRYSGGSNMKSREAAFDSDNNAFDNDDAFDTEPQEEWSEVDAALQSDARRPSDRGERNRRGQERRPERSRKPAADYEPMDEEIETVAAYEHAPSWDDAIESIVSGNIARHRSSSGRGRR